MNIRHKGDSGGVGRLVAALALSAMMHALVCTCFATTLTSDGAADMTTRVRKAVESLPDGGVLAFAPGVYHFYGEGCAKMRLYPSNNTAGDKKVLFPIVGKRNVTIDAGGATLEWLRETYPGVTFHEVQGAIGGTGSGFGVYRYDTDVLAKKPDLVFVEFSGNDAHEMPKEIWRNFDGIVRKTWRQDSRTDIVFVYTMHAAWTNEYGKGVMIRSASAMDQLADHYGIPSVCFAPRVMTEFLAGRIRMSGKEPEEPGKILFAQDPSDQKTISAYLKKNRPDAIVCGNDTTAAYLGHTLDVLGIRVPEDIMLAGFDDVQHAYVMSPQLTTIHQPCHDIADVAVRRLLSRIEDPNLEPMEIFLPSPLVERGSTQRIARVSQRHPSKRKSNESTKSGRLTR